MANLALTVSTASAHLLLLFCFVFRKSHSLLSPVAYRKSVIIDCFSSAGIWCQCQVCGGSKFVPSRPSYARQLRRAVCHSAHTWSSQDAWWNFSSVDPSGNDRARALHLHTFMWEVPSDVWPDMGYAVYIGSLITPQIARPRIDPQGFDQTRARPQKNETKQLTSTWTWLSITAGLDSLPPKLRGYWLTARDTGSISLPAGRLLHMVEEGVGSSRRLTAKQTLPPPPWPKSTLLRYYVSGRHHNKEPTTPYSQSRRR